MQQRKGSRQGVLHEKCYSSGNLLGWFWSSAVIEEKVYFIFKTSFKKELYKIIVVYEALVCYYAELFMS